MYDFYCKTKSCLPLYVNGVIPFDCRYLINIPLDLRRLKDDLLMSLIYQLAFFPDVFNWHVGIWLTIQNRNREYRLISRSCQTGPNDLSAITQISEYQVVKLFDRLRWFWFWFWSFTILHATLMYRW